MPLKSARDRSFPHLSSGAFAKVQNLAKAYGELKAVNDISFEVQPGALYPLDGLPTALQAVTNVNPLSYGIDGLRTTLIGMTHFGLPLDFGVLTAVAVVFLGRGAYSFSKIQL